MLSKSEISKLELKSNFTLKDIEALTLLANHYIQQGLAVKALETFDQITKLDNSNIFAWMQKGSIYQKLNYHIVAINNFLQVLKIDKVPDDLLAVTNLSIGCCFDNVGITDRAIQHYLEAIKLNPNKEAFYISLLLALHRNNGQGFKNFYNLSKVYNDTFLSKYKKCDQSQFKERMDPGKKVLNLGFLSCDLYNHPVMTNFFAVLEKLSLKEEFNLFFYHTGKNSDHVTEQIKEISKSFHFLHKKPLTEITNKILEDKVDILFDLSGYENREYFGVLKAKPAPVQVTHLGYWGTLGMKEVDFIIADETVVKKEDEEFFSEIVYKIPECYSSGQLSGMIEAIKEPPCIKNGYITFGSMNKFHKVNSEVIAAWANLLKKVPNSKLLFGITNDANENVIYNQFENFGIDRSRIILKPNLDREKFLAYYNEIDIALNPFPFSGGTTSLESLYMGVPVINLDGDTWAGRLGTTITDAVGHSEFNCMDIAEYTEKACALANDVKKLKFYRETLKNDVDKSSLNIDTYSKKFINAINDMWRISCERL